MKVTQVRVNLLSKNRLIGYADVTLDDAIAIKGIKVMTSDKGRYLVFPDRPSKAKDENGKTRRSSIAFPVTKEAREMITNAVLEYLDAAAGLKEIPTGEPEALPQAEPQTKSDEFGL